MDKSDDQVVLPLQQQQPRNQQQNTLANYKFSPEELKALRECDYEAFVKRSLPFGTIFGLTAYYGVRNGYLKPNVKWGPAPKVIVGVLIGYFLGKFSYQTTCVEKIMQIPNSKLAEMLKMKRKGSLYETFTPDQGFGAGLSMAPFSSASETYTDEYSKSTSLNLDTERPSMSGLEDFNKGNVDDSEKHLDDDLPLVPPKQQTTYDELRQRNRDEYAAKRQNPYYRPVPPPSQDSQPVIRPNDGQSSSAPDPITPKGPKNKYGDTWAQ